MSKETIIIASHNEHKITEINAMLSDGLKKRFQLTSCKNLNPAITWNETGSSFKENAQIKVTSILKHYPKALVLADDSGLCVPALGGIPGIYSSRYAGEHASDQDNLEKLLEVMKPLRYEERLAYFHCALCFQASDGKAYFFEGRVNGRISDSPSGVKGFGYDPIFIPEGFDISMADLEPSLKNNISHRSKAVQNWLASLTT